MSNQPLDDLKQNFSGEIIVPGDAAYGEASTAFAGTGEPAVVLRPPSNTCSIPQLHFVSEAADTALAVSP